jgi:PAS domain S-box-containing protein
MSFAEPPRPSATLAEPVENAPRAVQSRQVLPNLPRDLAWAFRHLSVDVSDALSEIAVPAFVLDRSGRIRWVNTAAVDAFGDRRGEHYAAVVAPEARGEVDRQFSSKIAGATRATSYEAVLVGRDGDRRKADIDSVRLEDDGRVVGVFGIIDFDHTIDADAARAIGLTPRQLEVLRLLAGGRSTEQIADGLHISRETARNHVRHVLRALGAHTRLEAVAHARALRIV